MSLVSTRIVGVLAAATLVVMPLAAASPAAAASKPAARDTFAMGYVDAVGREIASDAKKYKADGRSTKLARKAIKLFSDMDSWAKFTGLTDVNHDGLDDDAKISVGWLDNRATLTLRKDGRYTVTDTGFVFKNRRSVLKESAQAFDRWLRASCSYGKSQVDLWDMMILKEIMKEMPVGVRVVSDYDGNRDGYDDDGRLTFLANGEAVTLTIGNTVKEVGKVTYGPTWKNKAPKRTHKPEWEPIVWAK